MQSRGRVPWAAAAAITAAAAQVALLLLVVDGRLAPTSTPADAAWLAIWVGYALAGAVVLERRPRSAVGVVLCVAGALPAIATVVELAPGAGRIGEALYAMLPPLLLVGLPTLFPDGVEGSSWRRAGLGATLGLVAAGGVGVLTVGGSAAGPVLLASALIGVGCLGAHASRLAAVAEPQRTQRRIFLSGFAATAAVLVTGALVSAVAPGDAGATGGAWLQVVGLWCTPAGVVLAMLAGGLWDTDLARGRRAAHVGLVALLGVVSGLVVAVVAALAGQPFESALAAVVGVAAIAPLLWWVWRWSGRWLYGSGAIDEHAQAAGDDDLSLVRLVALALRAPEARIETDPVHRPAGALVRALGSGRHLVVAPRREGESFTRRDHRAADRMAELVGARLERRDLERELAQAHAGLERYREREQRRLRAALHDDVGPLLVGAEMQARALCDAGVGDVWGPAAAVLSESLTEARTALRAVLDEGSPRALAAGIGPALAELCARWPEPEVRFVDAVADPVATDTAGAVYRLVAEALANVAQHAQATSCQVSLTSARGQVEVTIEDDGIGIAPDAPRGIGLASMRGRALELGGDLSVARLERGTRVVGWFALSGTAT